MALKTPHEPYVDLEVLRSWVGEQRAKCRDGTNETHLSMMFAEIAYYLDGVQQRRDALERYGF